MVYIYFSYIVVVGISIIVGGYPEKAIDLPQVTDNFVGHTR